MHRSPDQPSPASRNLTPTTIALTVAVASLSIAILGADAGDSHDDAGYMGGVRTQAVQPFGMGYLAPL